MKLVSTGFDGLFLIETIRVEDNRGLFEKPFTYDLFKKKYNIDFTPREVYYSISEKNVIRGMHFQVPPDDHNKLVYVPSGQITDVVIDLRKDSKTFKSIYSTILSEESGKALFIPKGFAHGFLSLESNTNVTYLQDSVYSGKSDSGILYHSIGFDWGVEFPILSDRDKGFMELKDFQTPF